MIRFSRLRLAAPVLVLLALLLVSCGTRSAPKAVDPFARLALGRSQRLTLRSAAGTEQTLVNTPPGSFPTSPVWSPDGSRIAYVQSVPFTGQAQADWGGDIYLVPAAGGTPQLLRQHAQPGEEIFGLAWAPDGKSLFAGVHVTTFTNGAYGGTTQRLERLDLAGSAATVVVPNAIYPSLSRDGSKLAYLTQDPETGQGGIWIASNDGRNARQLVEYGEKFPAILSPRISPSGDAVAFSAPGQRTPAGRSPSPSGLEGLLAALLPRAAAAHGLPMDIWRVSIGDGAIQQLTHVSEDDPNVAWSADGEAIAFIATGGLYTVNADGSSLKRLGQGEFNGNIDAAWTGAG